jgi:hypothetical protein
VCPVQPISLVCCVQWYGMGQAALEAPQCKLSHVQCLRVLAVETFQIRHRDAVPESCRLFGMRTCGLHSTLVAMCTAFWPCVVRWVKPMRRAVYSVARLPRPLQVIAALVPRCSCGP